MPLVPFSTIVRLGAQPFATAASYKLATYANGDFPGVNLYTTFSPTFKLQVTYVAIDENLLGKGAFGPFANSTNATGTATFNNKCQTATTTLAGCTPQSRGDNFALIGSPEITVMKGLDIKPMFSHMSITGLTSGAARQGRGGVSVAGRRSVRSDRLRERQRQLRRRRQRRRGHGRARVPPHRRRGRQLALGPVVA